MFKLFMSDFDERKSTFFMPRAIAVANGKKTSVKTQLRYRKRSEESATSDVILDAGCKVVGRKKETGRRCRAPAGGRRREGGRHPLARLF